MTQRELLWVFVYFWIELFGLPISFGHMHQTPFSYSQTTVSLKSNLAFASVFDAVTFQIWKISWPLARAFKSNGGICIRNLYQLSPSAAAHGNIYSHHKYSFLHLFQPDTCNINGFCFSNGEKYSGDQCYVCNPASSQFQLTASKTPHNTHNNVTVLSSIFCRNHNP